MLEKFIKGFIWGSGFSIAIIVFGYLAICSLKFQVSDIKNPSAEKEEIDKNFHWYNNLISNSEDDIYGFYHRCLAWATDSTCIMYFNTKHGIDLKTKLEKVAINCTDVYGGFTYAFGENSSPRKEDIYCYSMVWNGEEINLATELNQSSHYVWQFSRIE